MIKITQQNEQMFYWHVHCCKQHLAWKSLPKSFDCYKLGGFSKNYGELFSIDLYGPKEKLAVPRLCNEIMLTASVFAPQPELPSLYVEVLRGCPNIWLHIAMESTLGKINWLSAGEDANL